MNQITELANIMYENGYTLEATRQSMFMAILNRPGTTECEKHRPLSIMKHMGKTVRGVLRNRLRKYEKNVARGLFDFKAGKDTSNAVFCLGIVTESAVDIRKDSCDLLT